MNEVNNRVYKSTTDVNMKEVRDEFAAPHIDYEVRLRGNVDRDANTIDILEQFLQTFSYFPKRYSPGWLIRPTRSLLKGPELLFVPFRSIFGDFSSIFRFYSIHVFNKKTGC